MNIFFAFTLLLLFSTELLANPTSDASVSVPEPHPDVVIKLIKRGAGQNAEHPVEQPEGELEREKRRSSSKKNKGRKVGKK